MPTILLKKSDTPGSVPGTANLTNLAGGAEVAVNTADKRMFSMTSASAVIELGTNPSSLTCSDGSFVLLKAASASITNLTATSLVLSNLSIASANITTLTSASATITNLVNTSASITTLTNNPTFSAGTANGVLYLNGSKVATSGSALTFNGTDLSLTTTGAIYKVPTAGGSLFDAGGNNGIYILGSSNYVATYAAGAEGMRLTSTSLYTASGINVGIGTASPAFKLDVETGAGRIQLRTGSSTGGTSAGNGIVSVNTANNALLDLNYRATQHAFISGASTSTAMLLDASGNLGLGVTPSTSWFASSKAIQIGIAGAPYMGLVQQTTTTCDGYMLWGARLSGDRAFQYTSSGDAVCAYRQNAGTHNWFTAASGTAGNAITFTQAMTLDASGNLGVGTTSPAVRVHAYSATAMAQMTVDGAGAIKTGINFASGGTTYGQIYFDNNSPYDMSVFQQYSTGSLRFGTNNTERARITAGGFSKFSNTGTYASSTSDRHELRSDKNDINVLVSTTSTGSSVVNVYSQFPAGPNAAAYHFAGVISGSGYQFTVDADGDVKNTNGSYAAISDIKLKQDIEDSASQWEDIKSVRVRKYRFKRTPDAPLQIGVIAQELEQTSPGLVSEDADRDEENNDLGTTTKSVKYSILYMKAVKALQEAMARIEQLEAKVAALESA